VPPDACARRRRSAGTTPARARAARRTADTPRPRAAELRWVLARRGEWRRSRAGAGRTDDHGGLVLVGWPRRGSARGGRCRRGGLRRGWGRGSIDRVVVDGRGSRRRPARGGGRRGIGGRGVGGGGRGGGSSR